MPKVETSLSPWGKYNNSLPYYVSLKIGNKLFSSNRNKRSISDNLEEKLPKKKKRRRVVKKLVRVEPVTKELNNELTSTESDEVDTTTTTTNKPTRKIRRRLRIKKKKRLLSIKNDTNTNGDYEDEDHLQQATKPRRKIVITRKRLLPNKSKYNNTNLEESMEMIRSSQTTDVMYSSSVKQIFDESYVDHVSYDDGKEPDSDEVDNEDHDDSDETDHDGSDVTEGYDDSTEDYGDSTDDFDKDDDDEYDTSTESEVYEDNDEEASFNEELKDDQEDSTAENLVESIEDKDDEPTFQSIPEYEPSFPELTESFDSPVLLLKTTILSSVETLTKTTVQSKLRTYTFVVTRVSGSDQIITSTTEVKPVTKTITVTEPFTSYTTLTLLDFDATQTLTERPDLAPSTLDNLQSQLLNQDHTERSFNEEARYNLATRVMSNGVEVIVAGDKTTLPGEPDVKRLITTHKPVTLKPSTLTDHMVLMLPQEGSNADSLSASLYPDQFVTKTCLTTFTYLTTYLEGSTTTVSSHEQVVANVATEERNTGKILPTPAIGITLTQYPNLSVGIFHTTYTYLNTILDGEQPLVVSSKHTVTNMVTAPDDYLSLLKPTELRSALKDTNTYFSTIGLEKTLYEGDRTSVTSTSEVVTQVVITESVPPRATSVMTSYIALDEKVPPEGDQSYSTSDVVKTYFVTYTYYNTLVENGQTVVHTNVSTSSDIVTEKLYLQPKKSSEITGSTVKVDKKKQKINVVSEPFKILATKTYFTTFTYFTTLLQEGDPQTSTVVSSRTKVVENLVTETIDPNMLDKKYLKLLRSEIKDGSETIVKLATLQDGQKLEITAIASDIHPTKVLPIEKTEMPEMTTQTTTLDSSASNVVTGSTIVFLDEADDPFNQILATPTLNTKVEVKSSSAKHNVPSVLSSQVIENTQVSISISKVKRPGKKKSKTQSQISASKTQSSSISTKSKITDVKSKPQTEKKKQTSSNNKVANNPAPPSDLLGLGSINMNSFQALTPVLNAMAGLISTNLKSNRRSDVNVTTTSKTPVAPAIEVQNRSPIYIPVRGLDDDFEIAESQNIATFDWVDSPQKDQVPGKSAHEASLLNGGIPISPGEIITANSDVIVGKPGRIGPRIPSIPLQHYDDVPLNMKPPPAPNSKAWAHYKHLTKNEKPAGVRDGYLGPPPPPPRFTEDKVKHIPLSPVASGSNKNYYYVQNEIPQKPQQVQHYDQQFAVHNTQVHHEPFELQASIQHNYDTILESTSTLPVYAPGHGVLHSFQNSDQGYNTIRNHQSANPINDFNFKASVLNEPIVLPEIIERSTGQPLLVNIQPSQVAFINIPFNRTTALIYGGSTEPHHNGQYFDDPSPYPETEFSVINDNGGATKLPSLYQGGDSANQKQVNGVIKVGTQFINVEPVTSESKVRFSIEPSKPQLGSHISINAPPISYGLLQQGNDFNAHVINHGGIEFRPPSTPLEIITVGGNAADSEPNEIKNEIKYQLQPPQVPSRNEKPVRTYPEKNDVKHHQIQFNSDLENGYQKLPSKRPKPTETPKTNPEYVANNDGKLLQNKPKYPFAPKRNMIRPKTEKPQPLDYMTPPPPPSPPPIRTYSRRPVLKKPLPIPLRPNVIKDINYYSQNRPPHNDDDIGDHRDDDMANEDGEVIQESNNRPLLPGEVPYEILKTKASTTTERTFVNNNVRFPSAGYVRFPENRPVLSANAKPFATTQNNLISILNAERGTTERYRPIKPNEVFTTPKEKNELTKTMTTTTTNKPSRDQSHTSQKPVFIFIDDEIIKNKDEFFHHKKETPTKLEDRPTVTSLPIDLVVPTYHQSSYYNRTSSGTQTEKPFASHNLHKKPNNEIVRYEPDPTTKTPHTPGIYTLNTGEVTHTRNSTRTVSDLEILKPPPLENKTVQPFLRNPIEEMLPPPQTSSEVVLGMSPPPVRTPTSKPIYSMEIDVPSSSTSTQRPRYTRPRRPLTRRPAYATSSSPTTTGKPTTISRRRPIYPHREITTRRPTTKHQTTTEDITPSPTNKIEPSLEVIVGNPTYNNQTTIPEQKETFPTTETTQGIKETTLEIEQHLSGSENVIGIHHTGNEVKIMDESSSSTTTTTIATPRLPVRYITHTKTSTITVTKTTVVKTSGSPPSTLTILVTKTEKSTIIDTVTEVHTVVKPTSIVETITTTVQQVSSLYPSNVYGRPYPSVIHVTSTMSTPVIEATAINADNSLEDDLEDFIITDVDPPPPDNHEEEESIDNNSILVVMTDKNTKNIVKIPNESHEAQGRDEIITDSEANNIILSGIFIKNGEDKPASDKCNPECLPTRNEICQKYEGGMRCVCRPGFARMFLDRPCLPTYTYDLNITLERIGKDSLHFYPDLGNTNTSEFVKFAAAIREALDRMVMQSDIRDIFHGVEVHAFEPGPINLGIMSRFYLQLSENIDEKRLENVFRGYLRNNSYSLGGTDIIASHLDLLRAKDFDECSNHKFHDCSKDAQCFNLKGTYTCSCKEGFSDLSENILYPGRVCSAEQIGCERCNYHGACFNKGGEETVCECFHWYAGESCHINLKVLLIALATLGALLLVLLLICTIMTCCRRKQGNSVMNGMSFLPQRVISANRETLDRRVMIQDTSSEDSRSETNTLPRIQVQKKPKGALKKPKVSLQLKPSCEMGENNSSKPDQKDRSLTVMIPRAKYHPAPPTSPLMNYTTFDARKPSVPSINEAKLLSYLDAGPSPNKTEPSRKFSNVPSESYIEEKATSRKTSGALVSAGFEVSATVVNNMGTLGTNTCGTEADRSENATLIQKISAELLSSTGTRSQFNTLRKSLVDEDLVESSSNWLDLVPRVMSVSEARSFDETTIPPPMKSFRTDYDSKPSSQHQNDEANTMAERDVGSTFLLPHTHLYKPDRGSDISGFESL